MIDSGPTGPLITAGDLAGLFEFNQHYRINQLMP